MLKIFQEHNLNLKQMIQAFYNDINVYTRQLLDSKGLIMKKICLFVKKSWKVLLKHSREWPSPVDEGVWVRVPSEGFGGLASVNVKKHNTEWSIKKKNQTIHAIQVGCDKCSGPHLMKDTTLMKMAIQKRKFAILVVKIWHGLVGTCKTLFPSICYFRVVGWMSIA